MFRSGSELIHSKSLAGLSCNDTDQWVVVKAVLIFMYMLQRPKFREEMEFIRHMAGAELLIKIMIHWVQFEKSGVLMLKVFDYGLMRE